MNISSADIYFFYQEDFFFNTLNLNILHIKKIQLDLLFELKDP